MQHGLTKIRDADGHPYDYNSTAHSMGFYAQKVQGSAFPDRYDQRMDQATALFTRLTGTAPASPAARSIPSEKGFLMALTDDEQHELLSLARQEGSQPRTSRSPLRHVGEHDTETLSGFEWNTDANVHVLYVELRARLGDPEALALLHEVANADAVTNPDRTDDRHLAQAILNNLAATPATPTNDSAPYPQPTPTPDTPPPISSVLDGDGGLQSNMESLNSEVSSLRTALRSLAAWVRT